MPASRDSWADDRAGPRLHEDSTASLLLVDDDPAVVEGLGRLLSDLGRLRFAMTGAEAMRLIDEAPPDLVLLDVELPDISGFEVCRRLKAQPALAELPVIFVTSHDSPVDELRGLSLGAVDFIHKPPRGPLVHARVRSHLRMKRMADALRRAADTDGLTGTANRRRFDEVLAREWARAMRSGQPLALLMADVDHFKAYNDQLGHVQGDHCLREVACAMAGVVRRPADLLARYGGEEFALLLPDTELRGAEGVALSAIQAVQALGLPHPAPGTGPLVSVSIGVCAGHPASVDPRLLVHQADRALYRAKAAGRGRSSSLRLDEPAPAADAPPAGTGTDG